MTGYKTVHIGGTGEIVEKKSRFIANVFHVETEDEALEIIEQTRKKYWDARHNCYAYSIGITNPTDRCSDDGEPQKTAGRPMLDVLKGDGLCNTLVIVTRYFGGTLLGTGGLVRAYQGATRVGIDSSLIIEKKPAFRFLVTTDYSGIGKLQYLAAKDNIPILGTEYTDSVSCTLLADEEAVGRITKQMLEATSGQAVCEKTSEVLYAMADGELLLFES